jgi:methylated-DNA-protein-cysteine methyltransferase-like protein
MYTPPLSPQPDPTDAKREAIFFALRAVPYGKVVSYGQLAAMAGLPHAARLAGKVLSSLPKSTELPWHRVVNAQGKISFPIESPPFQHQKQRLEQEGIIFFNNKINLRIYGYNAQ